MSDRGAQIEQFFWLLVRLCALAFGYLMLLGGGLLALAFLLEQWRTGAIAVNGRTYADGATRLWLTAAPALVAVAGYGLTVLARRRFASHDA